MSEPISKEAFRLRIFKRMQEHPSYDKLEMDRLVDMFNGFIENSSDTWSIRVDAGLIDWRNCSHNLRQLVFIYFSVYGWQIYPVAASLEYPNGHYLIQ